MKKILLIGLSALLLLSCKKSNIDAHQNYIGVWSNNDGDVTRRLEVESNGKSFYEEKTSSGFTNKYVSHNGKFILDGSTLKIGLKKLTINNEPALNNDIWYLTMENREYIKR